MTKQDIYYRLMEVFVNHNDEIFQGVTVSSDLWEIIKPTQIDPITEDYPLGLSFGCWGFLVFEARAARDRIKKAVYADDGHLICVFDD
jgi:hypothetical protein